MSSPATLAQELRGAARLVARVAAGHSLGEEGAASPRGALLDLTHGTLRRYARGQAIVRQLSRRGPPDALTQALLWCSFYALESGRYADYTVVDQAVRACMLLERGGAKGYVNGLLRSYIRQRHALNERLRADSEAWFQHPAWWIAVVHEAFPQEWEAILAAGNERPPMTLRVNRLRSSVDGYLARLQAAGISATRVGDEALLLERPLPVERVPGFAEGHVSVQDAGAQRAARCLDLRAAQRVLDACAAPGGKTAHMLETADVRMTALDADPARCALITGNLERLGLRQAFTPRIARAPRPGGTGQPSSASSRMSPALHRASCGVIRTRSGCAGRPTYPLSLPVRRRSSRRFGACWHRMVNCCMSPAPCFRRRMSNWSPRSLRVRPAPAACPCRTGSRPSGCRGRSTTASSTP
jgi:16S rRNA (cytosine967-C5)-methyltransferase